MKLETELEIKRKCTAGVKVLFSNYNSSETTQPSRFLTVDYADSDGLFLTNEEKVVIGFFSWKNLLKNGITIVD